MDMKSISQKLQDDIRAIMEATLHPNQQKIDVHEPEKDKITAHDFKKLRAMKKEKSMKEDADWVIIEQDEDNTTAKVAGHKVTLHRSLSEPGTSDTYTLHHPSGDKKVKISYGTHGDGEEVHGEKVNQAFGLDSKHKLGHKIAGSMSGMGGISKFEESVEQTNEEEKKKIVSPFDYKNYKSQIPKKPGELTGHDSKKTSTGTVYTKRPVKENTDIDEARLPRALHKMSADELDQAHKDNEAEIEAIHKNDPSKRITMNHPLISKRRSINLHKVIRSKQSNIPNYIPPKAHGYSEEVEIGEARKLEGTYSHTNGNQSKVYKLSGEHHEGDPYHVKLFKAGKHYEPADYFTNDKEDAHGTAKHMVKEESHQSKTTMKHIPNASPALKKAAKDIKPGIAGYRDRIAMLKAGGVKEEAEIDEAYQTAKSEFVARQGRLTAAAAETEKDPARLKRMSSIPGYSAAMDLAKKTTLGAKHTKEEVEVIDELSKTTLGSYAKKASRDAVITRKIGADFEHQSKRAKSPGSKAASDEISQKYKAKSWQRRDGIDKAVDRLTKEDVEQNEYTFADYLEAARAQYVDEDAVLVANEAFKNKDITLFSDQSQSSEA